MNWETTGKSDEALDKLVRENLPGRKALESLPLKELNKALTPVNLFDEKSPCRKPPQTGENMPQKQPEKTAAAEKEQPEEELRSPEM